MGPERKSIVVHIPLTDSIRPSQSLRATKEEEKGDNIRGEKRASLAFFGCSTELTLLDLLLFSDKKKLFFLFSVWKCVVFKLSLSCFPFKWPLFKTLYLQLYVGKTNTYASFSSSCSKVLKNAQLFFGVQTHINNKQFHAQINSSNALLLCPISFPLKPPFKSA